MEAFRIFSILTGIYGQQPDRYRDWINNPKSNGYEALHCTLMSRSGFWIEVQIRSRRMDDIAERGIAAHWAYKRDGYLNDSESNMDKWLAKVQEILSSEDVNALELLDIIHKDLIATDIVVFTPKGEQKSIQAGATVLDFAYMIHTDIGNTAIAAKVNMRLVPLSQELKTGDRVENFSQKRPSETGMASIPSNPPCAQCGVGIFQGREGHSYKERRGYLQREAQGHELSQQFGYAQTASRLFPIKLPA